MIAFESAMHYAQPTLGDGHSTCCSREIQNSPLPGPQLGRFLFRDESEFITYLWSVMNKKTVTS